MAFMSDEFKQLKLDEYVDKLPPDCATFINVTGTEKKVTTRLAYAFELHYFFEWLIQNISTFRDITSPKDFSREDVGRITSLDISTYLSTMMGKGKAERTVARKRAAISSFFTFLIDTEIQTHNPMAKAVRVKVHQSDEVLHLNMDEQIELLKSVESGENLSDAKKSYHKRYKLRDYALILLLLDTGMRVSELQQIDVGDISFRDRSVLVVRKGGNAQTLFFSDEAYEVLNELVGTYKKRGMTANNTPLFQTAKGNRLGVRAIEKLVKKYTAAAIPGKGVLMSPHKMRSSFAMGYYRAEKDILALQRKLGHKNLSTTNIYAKATNEEMKETRSVMEEARERARKEDA